MSIDDSVLNDAMNAQEPPSTRTYFGQVDVDAWKCVLQKGTGKVAFDPTQHDAASKRTAIDFTITPLASSRFRDPIKRGLIAESKDWTGIVRPSLQSLNLDLRGIAGRWVQIESVPNGQKYKDKTTGEEKASTTIKFVRVFASEAECEAAAESFFGARANGSTASDSTADTSGQSAAAPVDPANDPQRKMAAKFLAGLWKAANGDVDKFQASIKSNSLTAKYFGLDSPEVIAVVTGQAA